MTRPFRLVAPVAPETDLQEAVAQALDLLLLPPAVRVASGADRAKGRAVTSRMRIRCRVCDAAEGEMHKACWDERCPVCGNARIACDCDPCKVAELPRVPFVHWPNVCGRCGVLNPAMFRVPGHVWRQYIEPCARGHILCLDCWREITDLIDMGKYSAACSDGAMQ
jgi:hypothetical protein